MQVVTKITTAKVMGKIAKKTLADLEQKDAAALAAGNANKTVEPLFRMTGYVTGFKEGQGDNGPWVALKGDFSAVRFDTGEVFMAASAFIPGATNDVLANIIKRGDGKVVEFACDVGIRLADTATGYEYVVRQLVELDTSSSPSQRLLTTVGQKFALPAPKVPAPVEAPAPAPVEAPAPAPVEAPSPAPAQEPAKAKARK